MNYMLIIKRLENIYSQLRKYLSYVIRFNELFLLLLQFLWIPNPS